MAKKQTLEQAHLALECIATGSSLKAACEAANITVAAFLNGVDRRLYERAREAQADALFDEMADLERQCLNGDLNPQVMKAVIDSRKWRLARMKPGSYGEKMAVEHPEPAGGTVAMSVISPAIQTFLEQLGATAPVRDGKEIPPASIPS
jgi:hypothetical protein